MQAVIFNSVSSLVHVTRKLHEKCVRTFTFSCLLTFNAFGATLTTFTVFSEFFFLESYVKQTICTGAISCYRLLLNLDLTDSSRIQNSGWLRVDTILENGGKTLIGRESGKRWILGIIGKRRQRHTPLWRWCEQLSPKDNSCHFSKCQWLVGIDTVEAQWQHVSIAVCELDAGNPCSICRWLEIL